MSPSLLRVFAALGLAALSASAGATDAPAPADAGAPMAPSEVERFCGNLADAARDRRYALQKDELKQLQADLDGRLKALEAKRAEYETWLKKRDDFLAAAQENVVKIYRGMKPDAAAERLAALRVELAAAILMKLDARKAGVILNEMETKTAARITAVMSAAADGGSPS